MKVVEDALEERCEMVLAIQLGGIQVVLDIIIDGKEGVFDDSHCVFESDAITIVYEASAFERGRVRHFDYRCL